MFLDTGNQEEEILLDQDIIHAHWKMLLGISSESFLVLGSTNNFLQSLISSQLRSHTLNLVILISFPVLFGFCKNQCVPPFYTIS